jgi:cellulose synthase/poly-beta-1,6-N-acetylglucosamine synthase-like glycosyltransferase
MGQLHLTAHYLKSKKVANNPTPEIGDKDLPHVTIQLPIYNEKYVVKRLIGTIAKFNYPIDKLEIQVLDDSNDDTVGIIADEVTKYAALGIDIQHIRRPERIGFKAGALAYGMGIAKGEFIGIFDADFIPEKDFLFKTIPHFVDEKIGMVQTRWGHLNKDYSVLTKLQAFGLDAHFSIEQSGRSHAHSFINFNGTAGVWRKSTITDAGGWSADTLTEDLDLSYRAQLKGWEFKYLEEVISPAELPVIMPAIKSQQYRWNKGAAETAKKNLGKVLRSDIKLSSKVHALFHLFNSSVFVSLLIASLLSIPMLYIKDANPNLSWLFDIGSVFLIGFFSIAFFYWVATKNTVDTGKRKYYFSTFPAFLTVSMGLSFHNAFAVIEGLLGFKSDFIRTPKFNITSKNDSWEGNVYIKPKLSIMSIFELLLGCYFLFGIVSGIHLHDWGLMIFHVMLTLGFFSVFYHTVMPISHAKK